MGNHCIIIIEHTLGDCGGRFFILKSDVLKIGILKSDPQSFYHTAFSLNMSGFRRAVWADDQTVTHCTKCRLEFNFKTYKHHCRKCGLIFCDECSHTKYIIPQVDLVPRPQNWWLQKVPVGIISDEDNYRCPQRVCDPCSFQLKDIQADLRLQVSRLYS
jgi:hypothetical protein